MLKDDEEIKNNSSLNPYYGVMEPIFLRQRFTFIGNGRDKMKKPFKIAWGTITQSNIKFKDIYLQCKIQVTARAMFEAYNCKFEPIDDKCECTIEIFSNSTGNFENCIFQNGNKAALVYRDRSSGTVNKCTFQKNTNTSILVLDSGSCEVVNSDFNSASRFSIYLFRSSKANILNSRFNAQQSKAIFMLNQSSGVVLGCKFNGCEGGAISIAEDSKIWVGNFIDGAKILPTEFTNIKNSAVHAMKNSEAHVWDCKFDNCAGNGVNYEYSNGDVYNCVFNKMSIPAIAVFGPLSNPVIMKVIVNGVRSGAIVSRDCSSPHFIDVTFKNIDSHALATSDFSHPIIENCKFLEGIKGAAISCSNGAFPDIIGCEFGQYSSTTSEELTQNSIIESFCQAKPKIKSNTFKCPIEKILKIHHCGYVNPIFRGNKILDGENESLLLINNGNIEIDDIEQNFEEEEENEIQYYHKIEKKPSQLITAIPYAPFVGNQYNHRMLPESTPNMTKTQVNQPFRPHRYVKPHSENNERPSFSPNLDSVINSSPGQRAQNVDSIHSVYQSMMPQDPIKITGFFSREESMVPSHQNTNVRELPARAPHTNELQRSYNTQLTSSFIPPPPSRTTDSFVPPPPRTTNTLVLPPQQPLGSTNAFIPPPPPQRVLTNAFVPPQPPQLPQRVTIKAGQPNLPQRQSGTMNLHPNSQPNISQRSYNQLTTISSQQQPIATNRVQFTGVVTEPQQGSQEAKPSPFLPDNRAKLVSGQEREQIKAQSEANICTCIERSPQNPIKLNSDESKRKPIIAEAIVLKIPEKPEDLVQATNKFVDSDAIYDDKIHKHPIKNFDIKCLATPGCQNPISRICIPCGHYVVCSQCADMLSKETSKRCPICQTQVSRYEQIFSEDKCVICLDNDCDSVVLSCGHKCLCYKCATQLWEEKRVCPVCQARIASTRHIFPVDQKQLEE